LSGKVRENEFCKVVETLIFGGDKLITYWYFHQPKIWGGDAPLFLWINARGSGYSRRLRILCLSSYDVSAGSAVVVPAALDLAIRESSHQLWLAFWCVGTPYKCCGYSFCFHWL